MFDDYIISQHAGPVCVPFCDVPLTFVIGRRVVKHFSLHNIFYVDMVLAIQYMCIQLPEDTMTVSKIQ